METPTLDAGRFILRKLERTDVSTLFPTLSDGRQCLYLSRPRFESEAELEHWLFDPDWNGRTWIAVDQADGRVAGRFVAVPGRDRAVSELGYITVADRQGQGVARTCVSALISHLFAREAHRRVFAEIDAENAASIALIKRLGFVREGRLRAHERTHKGICDLLIYGLLREEWAQG